MATEIPTLRKIAVSSFAEIWECRKTEAKSLHATIEFLPGDIIHQIEVKEYLKKPNYLSVQIDDEQHIMLAPEFLQYLNHSCDPNVFFNMAEMKIVCLKKIEIGEEMMFFYPSTEWSMSQSFDCCCGSEKCLNKIQGSAYLPLDILTKYKLSEYIQSTLCRQEDIKKAMNLFH
ncbi:SET domain-containing protein-lysine N-methyltransferase [Nodularia harveyana UHCC-0300]|uniref:SET domain-containing protein-lysine N-methyltransferase n=1 Tax=Nodularia harveyana UHCC-0300 TaxID=2974287 RepID=A0ABU5UEN7_9CYAN|nr:SET domain-containing protein-lysine N-methyltransferase [Nodularia harveyana]MEA5581763.1 SET domain-containing protein-lysine N-methyltransferase [Nodularia harveyana UHCC-0300]